MSKAFFMASILGLIFLILVMLALGIWAAVDPQAGGSDPAEVMPPIFALIFILALIYEIIVTCLLVYKMWAAIQDGHARTTPGKAVGLLFVPFFGLYWVFVAFAGFARDYNALLDRHQLALPRLSTGLFTSFSVLSVISGIPYLGCLTLLPLLVVWPIMAAKTCDAVNALPEIGTRPLESMSREELIQEASRRKAGTPGWAWVVVGVSVGVGLLMIIGIIAAISIPSLLEARERVSAKKTMGDMRQIVTAVEAYYTDQGRYPEAATIGELNKILQDDVYARNLPTLDAWGHPFVFESQPDGPGYCLLSIGSDGRRDAYAPYTGLPEENPTRGADIVLVNSVFVTYPAGSTHVR
ncbi:MAG: type II secretion system protein GspG [Acidobacteria bacterium]|nr:type II secretion system protein GspG [Acidobacteriota bacterium]